jgi:hypothetical protein
MHVTAVSRLIVIPGGRVSGIWVVSIAPPLLPLMRWPDQGAAAGDGTLNEANLDGSNLHPIITGLQQPVGVAVGLQ